MYISSRKKTKTGFFLKEILLCNKLHYALYQENLNVQLLNDFLVLRELLQTLV